MGSWDLVLLDRATSTVPRYVQGAESKGKASSPSEELKTPARRALSFESGGDKSSEVKVLPPSRVRSTRPDLEAFKKNGPQTPYHHGAMLHDDEKSAPAATAICTATPVKSEPAEGSRVALKRAGTKVNVWKSRSNEEEEEEGKHSASSRGPQERSRGKHNASQENGSNQTKERGANQNKGDHDPEMKKSKAAPKNAAGDAGGRGKPVEPKNGPVGKAEIGKARKNGQDDEEVPEDPKAKNGTPASKNESKKRPTRGKAREEGENEEDEEDPESVKKRKTAPMPRKTPDNEAPKDVKKKNDTAKPKTDKAKKQEEKDANTTKLMNLKKPEHSSKEQPKKTKKAECVKSDAKKSQKTDESIKSDENTKANKKESVKSDEKKLKKTKKDESVKKTKKTDHESEIDVDCDSDEEKEAAAAAALLIRANTEDLESKKKAEEEKKELDEQKVSRLRAYKARRGRFYRTLESQGPSHRPSVTLHFASDDIAWYLNSI